MTKIEKIAIAVGVVVVVLGVIGAVNLSDKENQCNDVGGVMVKTINGYRCMKEVV